MTRVNPYGLCILVLLFSSVAFAQSSLDQIRNEYAAAKTEVEKHRVFDYWIDDSPESPQLLAREWSLAGEWVAAWLNAHPSAAADGVRTALLQIAPDEAKPDYLKLGNDAYLIATPDVIGNVFIIARINGRYGLAWSTAQVQQATGKQAEILAAWRPENARHGGRGPYWAASGSAGSVLARIGKLPNDAKGHPRFYIDGIYAQSAGGTAGAQVSVWIWDGATARPLVARDYTLMIDQSVGTRLEGDLLKVQQKKSFRTFFSCGMCEERQTDWIVRITLEGIEDLGETSTVPELDVVDELFYRMIHGKSAADVASPKAVRTAASLVEAAREEHTKKEWRKFPTLGMMGEWKVTNGPHKKVLCLSLDDVGSNLFTLRPVNNRLRVIAVEPTASTCGK